jgi:NTE family protein
MQTVYDDLMFKGATYADLIRNGRPLISVNATDVSYQTVFAFTQDQFDLICSDLTQFPLARAVAASNGFPVIFTPITLKSYSKECGGRTPNWVKSESRIDPFSRRNYLAQSARAYLDPKQTEYVHLMDGGISDNLAMRSMINNILVLTGETKDPRWERAKRGRRLLMISADGQSTRDTSSAKSSTMTGIGQIFGAVSGTQIDSYNFETLILAKSELERARDAIVKRSCADRAPTGDERCDDVKTYFEHLSLAEITDADLRSKLEHIPTGLTLEEEQVDQLAAAGEQLVKESVILEAFRRELPGGAEQTAFTSRPVSSGPKAN